MKAARGTAKVQRPASEAKLAVAFFWPFYGGYGIIDLNKNYRYAVVAVSWGHV